MGTVRTGASLGNSTLRATPALKGQRRVCQVTRVHPIRTTSQLSPQQSMSSKLSSRCCKLVLIESSEARPRAAGSARRARPPVSAGTSPPPAAAGDERGRGRKARAREGLARVYWLRAPPPAPPTAAAERRVAVRAAAVATDATGNECTAEPRLSGGQTSFGLEHPERHRTRK